MRLEGIDTMLKLASKSFLLPSVQYAMLCGWQRVVPEGSNIGYACLALNRAYVYLSAGDVLDGCSCPVVVPVPPNREPLCDCLKDVDLIPPFNRMLLEVTFGKLYSWAIHNVRNILLEAGVRFKELGQWPACSS